MCGLDVARMWELTPHQYAMVLEGTRRRYKHEREMKAWEMSNIMSVWTKKPVTAAQLLGHRSISAADYGSVEEFRAAVREAREEARAG